MLYSSLESILNCIIFFLGIARPLSGCNRDEGLGWDPRVTG